VRPTAKVNASLRSRCEESFGTEWPWPGHNGELYRKPPSLFPMVRPMTPYITFPFPQNGGRTSNGHISTTSHAIHFLFGSRYRVSGSADHRPNKHGIRHNRSLGRFV